MLPTSRKVLANWTPEQIAAASNKMRPDLIAVLNAMNDHGGDYPAAARALGIKLGTLKSRLHRARKAIESVRASQGVQPDPVAAKMVSDVAAALEEHGDQYFDELRDVK